MDSVKETMTEEEEDKDADGRLTSSQALSDLIERTFPQAPLVGAFGYGSGVFSQTLNDDKKHNGMLDMILIVDDTTSFHRANAERYPDHYATWLRMAGPGTAAWLQREFWLPDAKVFFHVVDDPVPMKYGIVHVEDLIRDLTQWESLYLAGRLHKPTLPIPIQQHATPEQEKMQESLRDAQRVNLQAAVAAALLLSPGPDFDSSDGCTTATTILWKQFYSQIAGLSYTGDFRMQVGGEDPLKIDKLVQAAGQVERFQTLYERPILQPLQESGLITIQSDHLLWNPHDAAARRELVQYLPSRLQHPLSQLGSATTSTTTATTTNRQQQEKLASLLASIVAPAARHQSFKGLFTLGFRRSIQYASAKLSKGLFRRRS